MQTIPLVAFSRPENIYFANCMSFGKWLQTNRKANKISQATLARMVETHGVNTTAGYISNLEREYYKNQYGEPTRPNEKLVDAIAAALGVPADEARHAAGYASTSTHYINGFEIQLPDDVKAVIPYTAITNEDDLAAFKESFLLAYEITKKRIAERDKSD